jgi:predicted DNA-binding transcriptional regulator AlpA
MSQVIGVLDVDQLSRKLNVSIRTIYRYDKELKIPAPAMYGQKNRKYWRISDIELWLEYEKPSRKIFERIKHEQINPGNAE